MIRLIGNSSTSQLSSAAIGRRRTRAAVCLAIHETSGADHFAEYDEVLRYIDEHSALLSAPAVRYVTASELRATVTAPTNVTFQRL